MTILIGFIGGIVGKLIFAIGWPSGFPMGFVASVARLVRAAADLAPARALDRQRELIQRVAPASESRRATDT